MIEMFNHCGEPCSGGAAAGKCAAAMRCGFLELGQVAPNLAPELMIEMFNHCGS
jgi:hypothetical protein